jgi:prepilin-type N-terminal cleavage/methylation domain-containing protein
MGSGLGLEGGVGWGKPGFWGLVGWVWRVGIGTAIGADAVAVGNEANRTVLMSGTRRLLCSRRMEEKGSTAMKLKNHRRTGAFTLVEIMIVVAIIGLLAAIAIPNFVKARETSQMNACVNNLRQIDAAKDQWALENGKATDTTIDDDAKPEVIGYLRREPKCPVEDQPYNYTKVGKPALCQSAKKEDHNKAYQGTDEPYTGD